MPSRRGGLPEWITRDYLEDLLRNSLEDNSLTLEKFTITPGSNLGDNFICQIIRIKLYYDDKGQKQTISIIGKILHLTKLIKVFTKDHDSFHNEALFVSKTLPDMYKQLHAVNSRISRFYPKTVCVDERNKTIYMEDLKEIGYEMARTKGSLDFEHAICAIKSLAIMHASGYLLLKKNPEIQELYGNYFWKTHSGSICEKTATKNLLYLTEAVNKWPISYECKNKLRKLKGNLYRMGSNAYNRKENSFNVLLHGDCWINNFMFKYDGKKVIDAKLFDFQYSNYNSIGLDLNFFIFKSVGEEVKTHHINELLSIYYQTFVGITGKVDGFDMDVVRKEFLDRLGFGLYCQMIFRPGIMSPTGLDFDAYCKNEESESNQRIYSNEKFISEVIKLVPLFEEHGCL